MFVTRKINLFGIFFYSYIRLMYINTKKLKKKSSKYHRWNDSYPKYRYGRTWYNFTIENYESKLLLYLRMNEEKSEFYFCWICKMSVYELNHQKLEMFHRNFINVFWNIVMVGHFISLWSDAFLLDLSSNIHLSIYCRNLKIWFEPLLRSLSMIWNKEDFLFNAWPVYGLWKLVFEMVLL